MKKKLLAISMAAALGMGAGAASAFEVTPNGIGHYNVLPYFSVQDGNISLIHITNTDEESGKAVKVRFRSAEWSDDVLDFQLFLSPGDVWTGYLSQEDGNTVLRTEDNTCSLPTNLNGVAAPTFRLVTPAGQSVEDPARTREGYVEVITMADIPYENADLENDTFPAVHADNTALANAIKHVDGVPACRSEIAAVREAAIDLIEGLDQQYGGISENEGDPNWDADAEIGYFDVPSASIASFVTILNVEDVKAFTVAGTAIDATEDAGVVMYFRQANERIPNGNTPATLTADKIFRPIGSADTQLGLGLHLYQFDLPDLTTPIAAVGVADDPEAQRDDIAIALRGILNGEAIVEYVTDENVLASTEVVLNQPIRRFFYEYSVPATGTGDYTISRTSGFTNNRGFNIAIDGDYSLPLDGNMIEVGSARFYDREEGTHSRPTDIVISPTPPSADIQFFLEGEVSVVAINGGVFDADEGTGSLGARLTAQSYGTGLLNPDGWGRLSLVSADDDAVDADGNPDPIGGPLPVIGFNAINLYNAGVNGGSNYSMTLPLRGGPVLP